MRTTAELRVPRVPIAVEIACITGAPRSCEVYLADALRPDRHALADDVAALLEADPPFLPVRMGSEVALWGKHAIQWLALGSRSLDEAGDGVPAAEITTEPSEVMTLFDNKHEVEVTLADGSTLCGAFLHTSPADKPRVADYLNGPARFVRLWTPRAQYIINKRHVAHVREIT